MGNAVSITLMVILAVIFIVFAVLSGVTISNNQKLASNYKLLPFSSKIDPSTGTAKPFTDINGQPQIQCPAGKKINIVGAIFNIFDPYNECSTDITGVSKSFGFLCDPTVGGPIPCTDDSGCPYWNQGASNNPFQCVIPNGAKSGKCMLQDLTGQTCPEGLGDSKGNPIRDGHGQAFCIDSNICGTKITGGVKTGTFGVPNPVCNPLNTQARCAIRDASSYVATKCDGRSECGDLSVKDFGDYPCTGLSAPYSVVNCTKDGCTLANRVDYAGLPFLPGFAGGVPDPSQTSTNNPVKANANIGYIMHGIYTCIDENT